jgi:N-hydroxyarylamine O-acetyltransferase
MNIQDYLERIGYEGELRPTQAVLFALHQHHLRAIPYENLDIHLQPSRKLTLDLGHIYHKIVHERRGGWCYEMNSLLAWALHMVGFEVQYLSGTVHGTQAADLGEMDHMILLVHCDNAYFIADAGFGNAFIDPLPLTEGIHRQGDFEYKLHRDADCWIFTNHKHCGPGFVFNMQAYAPSDYAARCEWLQTSPDSGFVRTTVCHRLFGDRIITLRGAVLQTINGDNVSQHIITTHDEYLATLRDQFNLKIAGTPALWRKVWHSHLNWLASFEGTDNATNT